jgi:serine/threonine protein kinase
VRELLGPYRLLERIATGGMGEIYLAKLEREEGFQKLLAVKRMLPHLSQNPTFRAMFQAEARIAALLTHQNIVQLHDFGRADDAFYMAMEYVHGVDLRTLLSRLEERSKPLRTTHALTIARGVCAGLDYAHRKHDLEGRPLGIVHRDISPQNILLSFEGEVKITDFGLAKAKLHAVESEAGTLKGKYSYVSPEQVEGTKIDGRSDLFSLGVVLYEAFVGERLFALGDSLAQTLDAIRRVDASAVEARCTSLGSAACCVLRGALGRQPEERFASAAEMGAAIDRALAEAGDAETEPLGHFLRSLFPERVQAVHSPIDATVVSPRPITTRPDAGPPVAPAPSGPGGAGADAYGATVIAGRRSAPRRRSIIFGALGVLAGATAAWLIVTAPGKNEAGVRQESTPTPRIATRAVPSLAPSDAGSGAEHREARAVPPSPAVLAARARIEVRSRPEGASIHLDGRKTPHRTPFVLEGLEPGAHQLRVALRGYRTAEKQIRTRAGETHRFTPKLEALVALEVTSEPSGAEIVWGGSGRGSTPARFASRAQAPPDLKVRLPRHCVAKRDETGSSETGRRVHFLLDRRCVRLAVAGDASKRVLVDKAPAGALPVRRRIGAGPHLVVLTDDERGTETKLRLRVKEPSRAPAAADDLVLNVDARPWAEVRINHRPAGTVPIAGRAIGLGTHEIELLRGEGPVERLKLTVEGIAE